MKALILITCLGLAALGCKKMSQTPQKSQALVESQGVITGVSRAPCQNLQCGGIEIAIVGAEQSQNYLIYSSMSALGITDSTSFPINVNLIWQHDTSSARGNNYITVSDVRVIN
jgi:hypothetical protein